MPDAFDFKAFSSMTPKYLGMDSLRDALPREDESLRDVVPTHHEPATMEVDDDGSGGLEDVSMADQFLEDDNTHANANGEDRGESMDQDHIHKHGGHEHERFRGLAGLQKIMSPTQYGAQMALRNRESSYSEARNEQEAAPSEDQSNLSLGPPAPAQDTRIADNTGMSLAPDRTWNHNFDPAHSYQGDQSYEISMPIPAPWQENLPYILSTYLQAAFNVALLGIFVYFVNIIRYDVSMKVQEHRAAIVRDASWCQHQYVLNQCGTTKAPPHLVDSKRCLELEHCMDADPESVRWLSMYASLLAEVLNELVKPLTMRTILLLSMTAFTVLGSIFAVNYVFGFVRARTYFMNERKNGVSERERTGERNARAGERKLKISAVRGPNDRIWRKPE